MKSILATISILLASSSYGQAKHHALRGGIEHGHNRDLQVNDPTTPPPVPDIMNIGQNDFYEIIEGSKLRLKAPGVLLNDTFPGSLNRPLFVSAYEELFDFEGKLEVKKDGEVTYTPSSRNFVGFELFQYTVCLQDLPDVCDNATVLIDVFFDVDKPNRLPIARDDSYEVKEDETLKVSAAGFLKDDLVGSPNGGGLFRCDRGGKTEGDLDTKSDGSFEYAAPRCFTGTEEFTYKACYNDYDYLESNEAKVKITVKENRPDKPDAKDDSYSVLEGEWLRVSSPGFLGNDEGDDLEVDDVEKKSGFEGTLDTGNRGRMDYLPAPGKLGTYEFTYKACVDGWSCVDCDEATVKIEVKENPNKPDAPPTPGALDNLAVSPGAILQGSVFTGAQFDTRYSLVAMDYVPSSGFTGTLNGGPDGIFTYGNAPVGTNMFTCKICYKEWMDLCSTVTVTVTTAVDAVAVEGTIFLVPGSNLRDDGVTTGLPALEDIGDADGDSEEEGYPLQECQADCDDDDECSGDLICFQRSDTEPVPGCVGNGADFDGKDFCIKTPVAPITSMIPLKKVGNDGEPEDVFPLDECEGDCDDDDECAGGLICYQRSGSGSVPGCAGSGFEDTDFCIRPFQTKDIPASLVGRAGNPDIP